MNFGDQTQVARLAGRCLFPPGQLSSPVYALCDWLTSFNVCKIHPCRTGDKISSCEGIHRPQFIYPLVDIRGYSTDYSTMSFSSSIPYLVSTLQNASLSSRRAEDALRLYSPTLAHPPTLITTY